MYFDLERMTTVDKFGRGKKNNKTILYSHPANGFKLFADGHYDMQQKILKNLGEPIDKTDATTREYVNSHLKKLESTFRQEINKLMKKIQIVEDVVIRSVSGVSKQNRKDIKQRDD